MNASRPLLAAAALAALVACTQGTSLPKEEVVATIDGKPISRNTFEQYAAGVLEVPISELTIKQRDELLETLIRANVVAAEAERSGIAAKPEVAGVLELQRLNTLENAAAQDYLKDQKPSDEEVQAEYDLRVAEMGNTQYQLAHIQVATQEEAASLIAQLAVNPDFDGLAMQHTKDAGTAEQGGKLPWATPNAMPESFVVAVKEMKKGEVFKTPLKSDAGWHVVKLVDTREAVPPPFEQAREQMVEAVQRKKYQAWTDTLVEKAKITRTP